MKWLDPVYLFGEDGYNSLVGYIIQSVFNGTLARALSAVFLLIGAWFIFRRKQTGAGIGLISLSVIIIFGKTLLSFAGNI